MTVDLNRYFCRDCPAAYFQVVPFARSKHEGYFDCPAGFDVENVHCIKSASLADVFSALERARQM